MKIIIQKFGGTSLKDDDGRKRAIEHIRKAVANDYKVVVVVSAMGRRGDPYATDTLLDLIFSEHPTIRTTFSKREIDLLMSCGEVISAVVMSSLLHKENLKAMVMPVMQAGIITNDEFGNARILDVKSDRIITALRDVDIVIVPGFQGVTIDNEITTLGRGGSDTSAAALGAVLNAQYIDIFTDVEGIMTADPSIVSVAKSIKSLTYHEVVNLAYQGAKVIHPRAVEIARQAKVPLRIRSTFSHSEGTIVFDHDGRKIRDQAVTSITYVKNLAQIKISNKTYSRHLQFEIFKAMAENEISVDFINISPNSVSFTVSDKVIDTAVAIIKQLGYDPKVEKECAKVAAVGAGMIGVPGVAAKIVKALMNCGIEILQSADSHTTIWVLVKQKDLTRAVNALHETFQLHK